MTGSDDAIEDDASIADDTRMLRRVPPGWIAQFRPDRSNFQIKVDGEGLSCVAWLTTEDLDISIAEAPHCGVVCITAGELRAQGYLIRKVPLDGNPNHCECYGKPTGGQRRALSQQSLWVHVPAGHDPEPYGVLQEF